MYRVYSVQILQYNGVVDLDLHGDDALTSSFVKNGPLRPRGRLPR